MFGTLYIFTLIGLLLAQAISAIRWSSALIFEDDNAAIKPGRNQARWARFAIIAGATGASGFAGVVFSLSVAELIA